MKIAVVGSGVSGLAAVWALAEHGEHEVHLYEADDRVGGHANTVMFPHPSGDIPVDTGFIVFNKPTYPNFISFLKSARVPYFPTEMTFSVSRDRGTFEWAGKDLSTIFCQPKNLRNPSMWRMIWDVLRFNACAARLVTDGPVESNLSIGDYLEREGYSDAFRDDYLIPMTAAIWSTPPDKCALDFPAHSLLRFLHNHHLLQITGKPPWQSIAGGSREYVRQITSRIPPSQIHLSTPIHSLTSQKDGVLLETTTGQKSTYDHVILACHSDTSLNILQRGEGGATPAEEEILGVFEWNINRAVLHTDEELMPKNPAAWSCWNYLTYTTKDANGISKANINRVALTYSMNELQKIPYKKYGSVLVTLNPPFPPSPSKTIGTWDYQHPVFSDASVKAQDRLTEIQGTRGISYAGAWTKYGFHEDGFTSGLLAITHICNPKTAQPNAIPLPFPLQSPNRRLPNGWSDQLAEGGMRAAEGVRRLLSVWVGFLWLLLGPLIAKGGTGTKSKLK